MISEEGGSEGGGVTGEIGLESETAGVDYCTVNWYTGNKIRNSLVKAYNGNKNDSTMKILHWNIGPSFWDKKLVEIQILTDEFRPDLVFISEANLLPCLPDYQINIPNYTIVTTKDYSEGRISRLVLLVKNGYNVEVQYNLMEPMISSIWVKIPRKGNKKLMICGFYREHKILRLDGVNTTGEPKEQESRFKKFIEQWKLADSSSEVHIIGDINIDMEKWNNPDQIIIPLVNLLKDEIITRGFAQIVQNVTRCWPGKKDSLVDHVWSRNTEKIIQCNNKVRGVSDHNLIELILKIKGLNKVSQEIIKRSWKNSSLEQLRLEIGNKNWDTIYTLQDPELANSFLEDNLTEILDRIAPNKIIQLNKKHKSWITNNTRKQMMERDEAREQARISKNENDWKKYRSLRNSCTKQCKNDKNEHFKKLYTNCENTGDTKSLYRTTKEQLGWEKVGPPTALMKDGKLFRKPSEIAEVLAESFKEKVDKLNREVEMENLQPLATLKKAMQSWNKSEDRPMFKLRKVTKIETLEAINKLSNSSSQANDRIEALVIKAAATLLSDPITHITNLSIEKNKFCNKWKLGKVVPIFKGNPGSKLNPDNYRQISLLPVISKIVERQVQGQILQYMESTRQLNDNNHTYRKLLGTTTAMLEIADDIFEAADERRIAVTMAIDQSAAFDCVRHKILDSKLEIYNFSESTRTWINSYLGNRSQYVAVGAKKSSIKSVKQGVPQGSVLGPLLYIIYTNKLSETIKDDINCQDSSHSENKDDLFGSDCRECGRITTYSDDSTYVTQKKTRTENQENLDIGLEKISVFLTANGLHINQTKTTVTEHMVKQKRSKINGQPPILRTTGRNGETKDIVSTKFARILGGNLQDDLSWKCQLETGKKALLPCLRTKIGALRLIARNIPTKGRLCLANGMIISKLVYLLPVWGGIPDSWRRKTQSVLNLAARTVL